MYNIIESSKDKTFCGTEIYMCYFITFNTKLTLKKKTAVKINIISQRTIKESAKIIYATNFGILRAPNIHFTPYENWKGWRSLMNALRSFVSSLMNLVRENH